MTTSPSDSDLLVALAPGPRSAGDIASEFGLSRQAIGLRLSRLRDEGLVVLEGQKRGARWRRVFDVALTWPLPPPVGLAEDQMWVDIVEQLRGLVPDMSVEAERLFRHAVTEMLNNAIDHSSGSTVRVGLRVDENIAEIVIADDGVGALQHVRANFGLASDLDALAHLQKGKQTTAPQRHAGEGLFFTSKLVDHFVLDSGSHSWIVDNLRHDVAAGRGAGKPGTTIVLRHNAHSVKRTVEVFDAYTNDLDFNRSRVTVRLGQNGTEFVSRSEAKRIAAGLEDFALVEVDFAGVEAVGQGFVDELLRVWATAHPTTELREINMSEEVAFMVRRGLPGRGVGGHQ